jgi:uroporphyrinogen-III synthase
MRLLVTRPEPEGQRTAGLLRARGHQVMLAPLLSIETIAGVDLGAGPYAALLMTSANAARAIATHPQRRDLVGLPVFTVGRRTAEAAGIVGFTDVRSADGDGADLARLVHEQLARAGSPILYLAGEDRARDLAGELDDLGLPVRIAVVYRAEAVRAFPAPVRSALAAQALDGVLHFSRRSTEAYLRCAGAARALDRALPLVHYCLSSEVAAPLVEVGAATVRVAPQPEEAALLELVE